MKVGQSNQYTLQCSHDKSVLIVPKELVTSGCSKEMQKEEKKVREEIEDGFH